MATYNNILELIGNTPIVELHQFDTGPCRLFMKLEFFNPGGSIKDRIAVSMIEDAEKKGLLKPGGTIVEATAGNTGIALALVAIAKGYKMLVVMPDKMSPEKVQHLKALGAEVIMTRSDVNKGHPEYYHDLAERISKETKNSYYINQFANPANPLAHETTTAPEIWEQMDHDVDAVVAGVGTSGTITGIGRYLKKVSPNIDIVLADPEGSILTHYINTGELLEKSGSWLVEGIGEDYIPTIADMSLVDHAFTVTDTQAFQASRDLLRKEGIFAGSSTGTLLHAALEYCRKQTKPKRVVTFACDTGAKYMSKIFNDAWLKEKGLVVR
ncbi:MAG: cysteine synthase family protein [Proteobacteria bacterium]|nr:cysteine synthase family protein [Pseudomonadota bacterium]